MQSFIVDIPVPDSGFKLPQLGLQFWSLKQRQKIRRRQTYNFDFLAMTAQDTAHDRRKKDIVSPRSDVIFRLDPSVNWANYPNLIEYIKSGLIKNSHRNEHNNQYLIYSLNYQHKIEVIYIYDGDGNFDDNEKISNIKSDELHNFVHSTYSLFEHSGHAYFELPSKKFSDYFFRVGNIQTDNAFSYSIFFWLLPYAENVNSIFADTWSISTTAAKISKYLSRYRSTNILIPWEFSANYLPLADVGRGKLKEAISRLSKNEKLLFLSSFTSSGRLRESVNEVAEGNTENLLYLSIFSSSSSGDQFGDSLCDIYKDLESRQLSGTFQEIPPPNKTIFEVHPRTYFPDYRKINIIPFSVKKHAIYKEFFEKYAGKGIMSVYKTGSTLSYHGSDGFSTKSRHHAFHVSASKLFDDDEFTVSFRAKFDELKKDLKLKGQEIRDVAFLLNKSQPSEKLRALFENTYGINTTNTFIASNTNFKDIKKDLSLMKFLDDEQNSNKTLVICIPMVIGGGSLGNIQIALRSTANGPANVKPNIIILIGLMRPNSIEKVKKLSSIYLNKDADENHGWSIPMIVETAVLPNWQEDRCPWRRELSIIVNTLSNDALSEETRGLLIDRKNYLDLASNDGISDTNVFFTPSDQRLLFNPESLFLDLGKTAQSDSQSDEDKEGIYFLGQKTLDDDVSEADLCCAVASAMQVWRGDAQKSPLHFSTIDTATIDDLNGYNESRLRAAIWRSLSAKELSSVTRIEETNFANLANLIFNVKADDKNYTELSLEALVAFQNDLPRVLGTQVQDWQWDDTKYLSEGSNQ